MRFPNALGLSRARGRGGVQFEGDGEITLPPVSQPIGEFSAPIDTAIFPSFSSGPVSNSFVVAAQNSTPDSLNNTVINYGPLAAGTWVFSMNVSLQTGVQTIDPAKTYAVHLVDPEGNTVSLWSTGFYSQRFISWSQRIEITFPRDGFIIRKFFSPNNLADQFSFFLGVMAFKIL